MTSSARKASEPKSVESTNGSRLYLIQFEAHPLAAQRAVLQSLGVDLLKYVPDDAFIARLTNASPGQVRALNFVRWVGPYMVKHKIHPRLSAALQRTNAPLAVNLLLSPHATAGEVAQVRGLLKSVIHESRLRQGFILRGVLEPGALNKLAALDAVLWIEPAPHRKLVDEAAAKLVGGDDGNVATPTVTQQLGFGGQGVTVCVADTGLDSGDTNTMHPDVRGRVTGLKFYPPLTDGSDGYGHGTHCAGIVAGNAATGETDPYSGAWYGLGVASQSSLFIERIFDDNANEVSPAPSDEMLTQDGVRNGAQIGANSWGNDVQGEYDTDASQFDELVRDADSVTPGDQPYILEFSAGNAGPDSETLDSPATGKNVIATGASENTPNFYTEIYGLYADGSDTIADFSSCGPCEDGRIKPDVVTPGTWIASMASSAAPDEAAVAWTVIDNYYVYMGGTSMSGPAAAGGAAAFVQYYKSTHANAMPSPALVKAALINSASELDESNGGPGPIPNFQEGWGRVNLTNLIDSARNFQFVDQSALLSTGDVYQQHTFVGSSNQSLKITLAYTDVAGFPGAIPALVNDLDLEVVGPDGTLYRGNQFVAGESMPNPTSADNLNNVEAVHLSQPLPGDYLIRVRAVNVVEDSRLDTSAIDQDFALVVSGPLLTANQGEVLMDRTNYTAPSAINLEVLDAGRAASSSVTVNLTSTTEPAGEQITLRSTGGFGEFTNTVATLMGNPAADGKLEVHNGDAITASYVDSSGATQTSSATAVLTAPVISGVNTSLDLGVTSITWQTGDAANSVIYYGTNSSALNLVASDPTLTTSHDINLGNLAPGATYYFVVVSTDDAGNSATNNNSGSPYNFVAVTTPPVLMVDAYESADGSPVIDNGSYTNALAATGYGFAYWNVLERGAPVLANLQPFRVVIWRTTDDIINYTGTNNTLTPAQQTMIQTYLNNGGSFFMASMDILTQLGDVPFRANVLQVGGFAQNSDPPAPCDCDEDFGVPSFVGIPGDPITSGMNVTLDYSSYPILDLGDGDVFGPDFGDTFTPAASAAPIAYEPVSGKCCGARFPPTGVNSPGRVVFLSFPLDTVPETGPTPDNETALLLNVLSFLDPGGNGIGTVTLDQSDYTIPSVVTVEVGDTAIAGSGHAYATLSAASFTNQVTVTLNESAHPGLFNGSITLVATNTALPGQLRVRNGDTITANYFDAAIQSNIVAMAVVDTNPPVITGVAAATNVGGAVVTWTTSEAADSLVQYGEGPILDHSTYNAEWVASHSITLSQLLANHAYYFQVVSRDSAGNAATDDNLGQLYSFTTPKTLQPPWFDNLESGAANWTVVPDTTSGLGSSLNWTLGTPNNGLQTSAYSGTRAWGSDLNGAQIPFSASSYLYSPVIDLTGFGEATLTFWDCFDFSEVFFDPYYYEQGQIMISSNPSTPPGNLTAIAMDFSGQVSDDWEMETVDLTPYVGHPIQIVFDYAAFEGGTTYGWLVDDVGVTGLAGGASGTVVISKNIGSGSFTLSGPISQSGSGLVTTITPAPPGQYVVQFGDVAFYQTPAPQTNTLMGSNILSFTGTYTFPDVNSNGISDLYEQYYFGSLSTNRTRLTDSDGDGMSDYAEFIAGTNPTNASSNLRIIRSYATPGGMTAQWSAIPGRIYQVQTSTNLLNWSPVSLWLQSSNSPMTYVWTNTSDNARSFRIEVRP
ncbi:MAG TPA: S8 family serine peptidase [Candidatus Saccharimonadales bacterium]|nr:S8 family serine peptidase [Candidatus Saccharimonadales bacterium]